MGRLFPRAFSPIPPSALAYGYYDDGTAEHGYQATPTLAVAERHPWQRPMVTAEVG